MTFAQDDDVFNFPGNSSSMTILVAALVLSKQKLTQNSPINTKSMDAQKSIKPKTSINFQPKEQVTSFP